MRQLRQVRAEPKSCAAGCASRTTDPAGGSNTLAAMSGMFSDTGNERLVPGLVPAGSLPTPAPSRRRNMAAGLSVGILLYLVSVGLVAIAIIGVFFGIGFFLLAQPTEELIAAAAPLPVSPLAQRPAVGEAVPQQESNSVQGSVPGSPDGEASASAARDATPSEEVLARRSTSNEATIIAPAQTAWAPEPEPSSPASPAPPPAPASPRVFAAEIRSAAAALPVSPLAQRPAVGEAVPQQENNSARGSEPMSPDGEASARNAAPSGEVLAMRSTSGAATIIAPAQMASAPEPESSSPASPGLQRAQASPRVLAEIAEFLAAQRAPAADEVTTFEQYRDFRIHDLTQRRARLAQQLAAPNLSAAEKKRLERQKTDYDWLAAMPAEERDRHFRERFDEIDANHDGKLDPEERAVWREKQREYYQQQATERAVNRFPDSPQPLMPPQAGQTNPFAQRVRNK
jgi:hypothetical protein